MGQHLKHEHLLVQAKVVKPIVDCQIARTWLLELIDRIGMKVMAGPIVEDCIVPGNEGISGAVILSTSHSVLHIWPLDDIPTIQFDLYSCSSIDLPTIWKHLEVMEPVSIEYKFLDRSNGFKSIKTKPRLKAA